VKLAFLFGPISTGPRPFNFTRIDDDPRGLTGTDNSFLGYARAMSERGHDVTIFASRQQWRTSWGRVTVRPYEERRAVDRTWDAALAWNDIAGLSDVSPEVLRVLDTQINDFGYTTAKQHEAVDLYLAPSAVLAGRLALETSPNAVWRVAPNGCDPSAYDLDAKIPGRCIYASSPDRGLHIVLEQWPRIRGAVPHATLRVFYHSLEVWFRQIAQNETSPRWNEREHARRAVIVRNLLPKLEAHGVEVVGSVSRRQMAAEYSAAQCLAFPCDTISFTEGFGVAALEGCASGAIPCLTTCDAFGDIYDGAAPMIHVRDGCHRFLDAPELAHAWADNVVRTLTSEAFREDWVAKGRRFAEKHAWPVLAAKLEGLLTEAREWKR
jgi:glycosyltransferase involved in cell wall biosynthesis